MVEVVQTHHHRTLGQRVVRLIKLVAGIAVGKMLLVLALISIGLNAWIFIEVADEVAEGETQRFDEAILEALRIPGELGTPVGPEWIAQSARDITALGSISVLMLVVFIVLGYLMFQRKWAWAGMVAASAFGGSILTWIFKETFERARPGVVPHLDVVDSYSFPSGHAMISAVVYLTLGALLARVAKKRRIKWYLMSVAMTLTFLVGFSRVFVGVHYPTDVVAGWSAGMTWAALCFLVAIWLERRSRTHGGPVDLAAEKQQN